MSSAKSRGSVNSEAVGRSFMYRMNNRGPKIEPWCGGFYYDGNKTNSAAKDVDIEKLTMFISTKVTLIRILKMVTSIKTDQKVTLMMKMRRDRQTLNGAKIGDARTEGGQSRPRRGARNSVLVCWDAGGDGDNVFQKPR